MGNGLLGEPNWRVGDAAPPAPLRGTAGWESLVLLPLESEIGCARVLDGVE